MNWLPIDRDENGFATEECLYKIRKSIPCSLAMKYQSTVVYMSVNNERDFSDKYDSIRTQEIITHYLPKTKEEELKELVNKNLKRLVTYKDTPCYICGYSVDFDCLIAGYNDGYGSGCFLSLDDKIIDDATYNHYLYVPKDIVK